MKQRNGVPLKNVTPIAPYKLTAEDLREFSFRLATLNNAKFQSLMVEEAFNQWVKNVRLRYDIPTQKFIIDPTTGVITPQGERNG